MPHSPTRPVLGDQDLGVLESCSQKLSAHHSAFPRGGVISTWKNDLDTGTFLVGKNMQATTWKPQEARKRAVFFVHGTSLNPHPQSTHLSHTGACQTSVYAVPCVKRPCWALKQNHWFSGQPLVWDGVFLKGVAES